MTSLLEVDFGAGTYSQRVQAKLFDNNFLFVGWGDYDQQTIIATPFYQTGSFRDFYMTLSLKGLVEDYPVVQQQEEGEGE